MPNPPAFARLFDKVSGDQTLTMDSSQLQTDRGYFWRYGQNLTAREEAAGTG